MNALDGNAIAGTLHTANISVTSATSTMEVAGNLNVIGTITAGGSVVTCDARLKTGVRNADEGLAVVRRLHAKRYALRGGGRELGLMAQDVQKAAPEAVRPTGKNLLGVDLTALIAILINAVNELSDKVERLERKK